MRKKKGKDANKKVMVSLDLINVIYDRMHGYDDEGPWGEGWQSDELCKCIAELESIREQVKK